MGDRTKTEPTPIVHEAHGKAKQLGAILVVESPDLHDLPPPNPERTAEGLAYQKSKGKPFQKGNTAASGRGPSLARLLPAPGSAEDEKRVYRKAASLRSLRVRELVVLTGGPLSSGVKIELLSWAMAMARAEQADAAGEGLKATTLREKASGFHMKALGIAEREAAARAPKGNFDPLAGH